MSGENIHFTASVENPSQKEIKNITVSLLQYINLRGKSSKLINTRHIETKVASVEYPNKLSDIMNEIWNGSLVIPSIVPSSVPSASNIIQIAHAVLFNFDTSDSEASKEINIPITIGTTPLIDVSVSLIQSYKKCSNGSSQRIYDEEKKKGQLFDTTTYQPIYPYFKTVKN